MRLTPSWLRSSSTGSPEEQSADGDTSLDVTIYQPQASTEGALADHADETVATEFVPDADTPILDVLDEMATPVTVDEIVDRLIEPTQPPVETWATVHERLHQDRLPELDEAGAIEFDAERGTVTVAETNTGDRSLLSPALLGTVSVSLLFVLAAIITASILTALTLTVAATTFAVWLVPAYGLV